MKVKMGPNLLESASTMVTTLVSDLNEFFSKSAQALSVVNSHSVQVSKGTSLQKTPLQAVPVSISLVKKPRFMELVENLQSLDKATSIEIEEILNEVQKPQVIEIKIKELDVKDHDSLWKLVSSGDDNLKALICQTINQSSSDNFMVKRVICTEGCVLITIIFGVSATCFGLLATIANWDRIKKNLPEVKSDIKNLYSISCDVVKNTMQVLRNWFGGADGPDFSY